MVRPLYLILSQYLKQFNHLYKLKVNIYIVNVKIKGHHGYTALANYNAEVNIAENTAFIPPHTIFCFPL